MWLKYLYDEVGLKVYFLIKGIKIEEDMEEGFIGKSTDNKKKTLFNVEGVTVYDKDLSKNKDGDIFFKKGDKVLEIFLYDRNDKRLNSLKKDIINMIKKKYKLSI